ncbi:MULTISPECIES: hypothetical protein [unclassified Streptomyces]|uniref:hypothetical protein n=1 Tax=unclassified Streptomyces TaxID=2593676 RepID=UPI002E81021B|nr:hypothetical protein [Streptomyces sp. NBC_00589]WTI37304.1 hypothetical protein OIC96_20975 [Streptomyces sp. NBC_00775]WUB29019.1 hypothetical protein OHA51_28760 [Streptomyces sp. NBC_00589]
MTSATFPRKQARIAVAAAGLAAALALTGCSSDDGGSGDKSTSPSASVSATESAATGDTSTAKGKLEGSWLATTDGKAVALVITGKQAALFATGGSVCSGTAGKEAGMQMIHLTCTDGNKDRASGMVSSVNSTSMRVKWEGFGQEIYTKSDGGTLPTGLPTASLGS